VGKPSPRLDIRRAGAYRTQECLLLDRSTLTALGRRSLPAQIEVDGRQYRRVCIFKNDFFAVTAMYEGDAGKVVLKVNREASFLLIPLSWVGRWLTARECAALSHLDDVEGVPGLLQRWGRTGLVREYIEGHALTKGEPVPDDFHDRLRGMIEEIHGRRMAYVDLEKCENVLLGDDGRPYLFDFQIAWGPPRSWLGRLWPARVLGRWLQTGDLYHLLKLRRRTRPDQMTPEERSASYRKPWYVHVHRWVTFPLLWCRRGILDKVDPRRRVGERGRVAE